LRDSENREDAEKHLRAALPTLTRLAQETVDAQGYGYNVTAELKTEAFPTRTYENQGGASENFTLPAGEYLALRIVIGKGEGRNWWCVVFPPLCAQTTTDVAQTAMAAGLGEDDVKLLTESDGGYVLKFKSIELWERLREKWSE
jgi:stage II sporulation protein R